MAFQSAQQKLENNQFEDVFDRAHLARYTMANGELEREIIGLFLLQLPATVAMIEEAETTAEWKLATHTLKGAAMAVGARQLQEVAVELEAIHPETGETVKSKLVAALQAAVNTFRETVRHIYP